MNENQKLLSGFVIVIIYYYDLLLMVFGFTWATATQLLKGTQHFKKHTFLKNKIKNSKLTSPYAVYIYGFRSKYCQDSPKK